MSAITAAVKAKGRGEKQFVSEEPVSHTDLLYYDNCSLTQELHVTERTLQRYRKNGKIRSTVIGGKVYYPKNFLIRPGEQPDPRLDAPEPRKMDWRTKIQHSAPLKPRSKVIDLYRLARAICMFRRTVKVYPKSEVMRMLTRRRMEQRIVGSSLELWPKKIKLTYVPMKKRRDPLFGF